MQQYIRQERAAARRFSDEELDLLSNRDLATCDKCGRIELSEDLMWLSAEDFDPLPGERLSDEARQYDAVCIPCYYGLLIHEVAA